MNHFMKASSFTSVSTTTTKPNRNHAFSVNVTGMKHVLFIETGFGADQHGQNATKVCERHRKSTQWHYAGKRMVRKKAREGEA